MKTIHLLETEIQQYSLNHLKGEKHIIEHIQSCDDCRDKAEAYRLIFSALKDQPEPAFDFDLSEMVMKQLPPAKPKVIVDKAMIFVLSFIAFITVGFTVVFFWSYFSDLISQITPMLIYLVITCVMSLMIFMSIDLITEYHKKLKILNYH